jgi:protein TonB
MNLTKYLFILSIIFTSINMNAQQVKTDKVYVVVDEAPIFPGCESLNKAEQKSCSDEKIMEYIRKHLEYPEEAKLNNIQGRVIVQCLITTDGSITKVKVLRGIGSGCDEAAVDLVENMPKWRPGYHRGEPVKVQITRAIPFEL